MHDHHDRPTEAAEAAVTRSEPMHRHDPDRVPPQTDAEPTAPRWAAGHVILAVVLALVIGALFNARDLLATAERQEFGAQRDVAVALARGLVAVADAVGLDEPRNAIDVALGRGSLEPVVEQPTVEPTGDGYDPVEVTPEPEASEPAGVDATEVATEEPTEVEAARGPVTAADPLTMYIGGDSMVEIQFGTALEDLADDTGMIEVSAIEFDRGSGLTRPDFIDWPAKLVAASETYDPDVMVLYFGGNDAQPMKLDGVVYEPADQEWQDEYRTRVAGVMDAMTEAGHHVYWMGLPITRDDSTAAKFAILNDIYASEAEAREGVTFITAWELFAGSDGRYSEYLPNRKGDVVDMRLNDGIHLTTAGAYHLARPTIAVVMEQWGIEPPAEDG